MPGFDKTGPMGMGSMTGRGFGPCGLGLGWRRRHGMGRGFGRDFGVQALKEYQQSLKEGLEDVEKELKELEKEE